MKHLGKSFSPDFQLVLYYVSIHLYRFVFCVPADKRALIANAHYCYAHLL